MGFLPKRITLQNLDKVSVYIEDTNNEYFNVQEVPKTLTQGRHAFKIFGSDLLRNGVDLKMELLDSEGNTIFLTPVDFIGEEIPPHVPYRYVTVEVYPPPINTPGLATLTILGEVNPNIVDVPIEFQNAYNVRYQSTLNIDLSTVINTQPIKFFKNPTTEFQEVVKAKTILSPVSESIIYSTAEGIPRSDLQGKPIFIETGSLEKEALPHEVSDTFKDLRSFKDEYKYKTGLRGRPPAIISRRGLSRRFASLEEPKFTIKTDNATFNADMQGGTIEIPEREVVLTSTDVDGKLVEQIVTVPKFQTKILEVIDDKTIVPEIPPTIPAPTGSQPVGTDVQEVLLEDFSNTAVTASYNVTNTSPSSSGFHFDSLLDLTIKDMRTFSGDIYRIRVHGNSESAGSDFTVLADTIVESPELLIDSDSVSGVLRTGYFIDQSHINTYWNKFSMDGSTRGTKVSATHTGSQFIDSLMISGSTYGLNESVVVETKPLKAFTLRKNVTYSISAKIKGRLTNKVVSNNGNVIKKGKLYFHLSGSNLNTSQLVDHSNFGFELTDDATKEPVVLQLNEDIDGIQNFETVEHTFKPKFNLDRTINTDTILQLRAESGEWFISDLSLKPAMDTGFSPDEFNLKVPIPKSTRPDRFDFLIEYFDINNNVAETVTVMKDVPISGSALVIDGDGNLLTGSLFMGNAVDSGIEAAGVNSAFVRSVGYEGFESASLGGKGGFMIFSGSVLPNSPDNYEGAGLEIHDGVTGDNESYFKFRTNPSILDIKTSTFFLGKKLGPTNFISGSNGNLQISSSNFELSPEGNVTMSGEITAVGGTIGGFDIASSTISTTGVTLGNSTEDLFVSSSKFKVDHEGNITASNIDLGGTITATAGEVGGFTINEGSLTAGTGNSAITMSSADKIISMGSGSTFNKSDLGGGFRVGIDTDGDFKFAVGSSDSYIHADSTGVSIKSDSFDVTASVAEIDVDVFALRSNNLFISSSGGGFISAGNPRPTGIDGTNKGIFLRGNSPAVLIGDANGSHIKFDGTTTSISSSAFGLGGPNNFISGSNGNIKIFNTGETTLSGSSVNIQAPKFFLGSLSQFVSGSNGNIEISSSNFHLDNNGNVVMSGNVTANAGTLGGFTIGGGAISSDNFFISGAASGNQFFISSSNFNVKAGGAVTASALQLSGGTAGGLTVSEGQIAVGSILKLKDSGQITGSKVQFTGGDIAGWTIDASKLSKGTDIRLDAGNKKISIHDVTFGNTGIQLEHNSGRPRAFIGNKTGSFIKFENDNLEMSSSTFFLGGNSQFISGSGGNLEVSSSGFHLTPLGDVTASNILLGSKGLGDFLEFNSGVLTVQGEVFANSINTPATATIPSASISSDGLAKFVSASIGGFEVSTNQINSTNNNLILKSSGHITGSQALFTGGKIGGWTLNANQLSAGNIRINATSGYIEAGTLADIDDTADASTGFFVNDDGQVLIKAGGANKNYLKFKDGILDVRTDTATISGSSVSLLTPKFYLGESSNFISGSNGNISIVNTGTTTLSGSSVDIKTPKFYLGQSAQYISGSNGNIEISSSNFHLDSSGNVVMSGNVSATTGTIGGFTIGDDLSNSAGGSNALRLKGASGQITASKAQITGKITAQTGTIGGFNIGTDLDASSGTLKLKGASGQITASAAQITGKVTATSGQIAGFTISGNTLTATNFTLDASGKSISLGTGTDIFIADGDTGIQLGHGTFASAPFSVTKTGVLKSTSGTIGGWSIGSDEITGGSMIIRSDGTIESAGFASDLKGSGFRLTAASGGFLEVENARIRGTLATAVFEKETVNAVGGQLYVANSTVLSGSLGGFVGTSDTTMSVANVGGFVANEILSAKKVNATGFATEYLLVQSASRDNPSSNTDFSGKLYVVRGYGSGTSGDSGSLGDTPSTAQTYSGSQVIVSTGKVGTGYIRLNANPSDPFTPYIDIVERTGSGIYDVDLKARLGDLSGLSSARLHGANPANQFGLYSKNVFLEGGIVANTGSIGGIEMESGKLYNGVGTHGNSNTGFYVDSGSKFSLGDKLVWDGSDLSIEGSITLTGGTGVATPAQVSASLNASASALQGNIDTVESNVSGAFDEASASLSSTIDSVEANISGAFTSTSASLASTIGTVSSSTAERIMTDAKGLILDVPASPSGEGLFLNYPHMGFFNNSEFTSFISASGGFLFKADDNNLISFGQSTTGGDGTSTKSFVLKSDNVFLSGSKVNILGERFFLGGNSQFISGSGGNIEISSSKFHVRSDGNVVMNQITASSANLSGKVTSTEGSIGGFDIGATQISSSTGGLTLNADGGITGSKFRLTGGVITDDVTIQGDLSANSISTPSDGSGIKATITSQGYAKFISASIGGFDVSVDTIKDVDENLLLKSNGQITASNAKISGNITITAGGAKTVLDDLGNATASLESHVASLGQVTASLNTATGSLQTNIDTVESNVSGAFTSVSASITSKLMTDISGSLLDIPPSPAGEGLFLNYPHMGFYSGSAFTAFISASGGFLFKADNNNLISFGQSVSGGDGTSTKSFVLKSDNVFLSGSKVNILGERFFLGGNSQFISGSGGNIEISSSKFHVQPDGDVVMNDITASNVLLSGNITILAGPAFDTQQAVNATTASLESSVSDINETTASLEATTTALNTATGSLQSNIDTVESNVSGAFSSTSASLASDLVDVETNVSGAFTSTSASLASTIGTTSASLASTIGTVSSSTAERIMTNVSGALLDVPANPGAAGTYLNWPYLGFYDGSEFKAFISASGGFLFKADDNNLISFGQSTTGGDGSSTKNFVLKSDNVFLSGSNVNILGERFFLGGSSQFVSGSNGNIEISSSKFHVQPDGDVVMNNITASNANLSGKVTATSGEIGGMSIETNSIESTADAGDGTTTIYTVTVNGSDKFVIDGVAQSSLTLTPGNTYRFDQADDSNENHPLRFVQTSGGTDYYTTGVTTNGTPGAGGAYTQIVVTQDTPTQLYYRSTASTGYGGSITVDKTSPLILDGNTGQITGSRVLLDGGKIGGTTLTTGSLFQGTGTHGNSNTPFFLDSGGKFSLGDKLSWDGSNLSVEGSITITAGSGFATAASVSGSFTTPSSVSQSLNASASALQTNINNVESNVSGAFSSTSASLASTINTVSSSTAERIMTDISGSILETPPSPSGEGLFLNYPHMGFYSGSEFQAFISASGGFLFKADDNNLISFGQSVSGGDGSSTKSFVLKSDNVFLSGSKVNILSERFFLGGSGQFVSGSNGNIEISSSKFHVKPDGDIVVRKVDATEGTIGNFHINADSIRSGDADITDSSNQFVYIKGADDSSVIALANGGAVSMTRTSGNGQGNAGGIFLKGDGTFRLGKAGGQRIENDGDNLIMSSSKFFLGGGSQYVSGSNGNIEISSSAFHLTKDGNVTMSGSITANDGEVGGFTINSTEISASGLLLKSSGQITASAADLSGKVTATSGEIGGWVIGSTTLTGGNVLLDKGNEKIQVGETNNNLKMDINSNKGVFTMTSNGNKRIEISDALNTASGRGVQLNNAILEISASNVGETNEQIGIIFGGERTTTGGNYMIHQTNASHAGGSYLYQGTFKQQVDASNGTNGIGYGGILYDNPDRLQEEGYVRSNVYYSYASHDVKLRVARIDNGLYTGAAATAGRFEISSTTSTNATRNNYIVALCAFAPTTAWNDSSGSYTSGMIDLDKSVSGFFGGGRFIVGKQDVGSVSNSSKYMMDISESDDLNTIYTHLKVNQSIGINVTPSTTNGRLDAGNDVVAYSSSDIRFKKNTTPIQDALFKIQQLQGIEFDWIPDEENHGYEGHDVGVIAQEVEKVLPEVVKTRDSGYKAVKYEKMIPLLIEGIKEQQTQIEELKQQIKEIKNGC